MHIREVVGGRHERQHGPGVVPPAPSAAKKVEVADAPDDQGAHGDG